MCYDIVVGRAEIGCLLCDDGVDVENFIFGHYLHWYQIQIRWG